MSRTKTYNHFCPVARSLEVIGEKWSLLIVRDLLNGPRRFTDLMRGLGDITPKWLTNRLRELEAAGLVERAQEEGRREVWYGLTPRGQELGPVVAALNVWGLRNAIRPAGPGERVNPRVIVHSFRGYLVSERVRPATPVAWQFLFGPGQEFWLTFDGRRWEAPATGARPDVRVEMAPEAWVQMLADGPDRTALAGVVTGAPAAMAFFFDAIEGVRRPRPEPAT
jgi:DNA-binding HxlR family transcriptional regulator